MLTRAEFRLVRNGSANPMPFSSRLGRRLRGRTAEDGVGLSAYPESLLLPLEKPKEQTADAAESAIPLRRPTSRGRTRRIPRAARHDQYTDAACCHVLNRDHARETVFHDDEDPRHFLHLLARYRDRCDLRLYHY